MSSMVEIFALRFLAMGLPAPDVSYEEAARSLDMPICPSPINPHCASLLVQLENARVKEDNDGRTSRL